MAIFESSEAERLGGLALRFMRQQVRACWRADIEMFTQRHVEF
jgi:hypothetical protein